MTDRPSVPARDVALVAVALRRLRAIPSIGFADRETRLAEASHVLTDVLRELARRTESPELYEEVIREFWHGSWWWVGS
jgi:hypothetical protein